VSAVVLYFQSKRRSPASSRLEDASQFDRSSEVDLAEASTPSNSRTHVGRLRNGNAVVGIMQFAFRWLRKPDPPDSGTSIMRIGSPKTGVLIAVCLNGGVHSVLAKPIPSLGLHTGSTQVLQRLVPNDRIQSVGIGPVTDPSESVARRGWSSRYKLPVRQAIAAALARIESEQPLVRSRTESHLC
jgi:hypothetical protein